MSSGDSVQYAPITKLGAGEERCGLQVNPDLLEDHAKLERLKLMLAAAFEGVEIIRNTSNGAGPYDLLMLRDEYIGALGTLSLAAVNKRLAELPKDPVQLLVRGPKVMQGLLVVRFRAQKTHLRALERGIEEVQRAIVTPDRLYDEHMIELFVPRGEMNDDLLKKIRDVLNFDLG